MANYFHLFTPVKRIAAMILWLLVYMLDFSVLYGYTHTEVLLVLAQFIV
jgi:hypothetical protein